MVGTAMGQLTAKRIYAYVSLGRLFRDFPKIIFISSIKWTQLAKYPGKFRAFINQTEPRRMFWSSANVKMQFKIAENAPVVAGPHIFSEGSADIIPVVGGMEPYQAVVEMEQEREELMLLDQEAHDELQNDLAADCQVEPVSDSSTD